MQVLSREEHERSRPADEDLPIEIKVCLKVRMVTGIILDVESSVLSAFCIPFVCVEIGRIIRNLASEIARVNNHRASLLYFVDRGPPVDLTRRGRVPDVSVCLVGVTHARRQICAMRHDAKLGDIEICLGWIPPQLLE